MLGYLRKASVKDDFTKSWFTSPCTMPGIVTIFVSAFICRVTGSSGSGCHTCAVCHTQLDSLGMSRPLTKTNCAQYGVPECELTPDKRVCSSCRCRSVRRRYTQYVQDTVVGHGFTANLMTNTFYTTVGL